MTTYHDILLDIEGQVAYVTLNRPEKLNAIGRAMSAEVVAALAEVRGNDAVRVIVLRGAGRAFCAGADLSPTGATVTGPPSVPQDVMNIERGVGTWLDVWHYPKPVIAQVHGYCIGGGAHLASFCDLVIVAEEAQIGWPKLPVGGGFISPVWSWFVGPRRAKEFSFLVGTVFSGRDAAEMGWANRAVPAAELEAFTHEIAARVANVPADVLAMKKSAINTTMDLRGFSTSIKMTAAWDAAAHASPSVEKIRVKIREVGLRKAIEWFDQGGMQDGA